MTRQLFLAPLVFGLGACSSIPPAEIRYYPAIANTTVTLTQTLSCKKSAAAQAILTRSETATVVTAYAADRDSDPQVVATGGFANSLADAEIKVDWYDDGRLKAVNQSSTGQGESIVKAAMSLVATVAGGAAAGASAAALAPPPQPSASDCDSLTRLGDGKPVTITYEVTIRTPSATKEDLRWEPIANDKAMAASIAALKSINATLLPVIFAVGSKSGALVEEASASGSAKSTVDLPLYRTAVATVRVVGANGQAYAGQVIVPTRTPYVVPIPRPKAFGKQVFALALNEAGGITSIGYTKESGTASALNAVNSVAATAAPGDAARAAAANGEADLILARQRLAACQAKPADCK